MTEGSKVKSNYKLEPPDGGYGYVICVAAILVFGPLAGLMPSFGMIYNGLLNEIGTDTTTMGFITGMGSLSVSLSGFFTSPLRKLFSFRQLAFLAASLVNGGTFGSAFVHSVLPFTICHIMMSAGFGILYNLVNGMIRDYFVKKRLFAMSIVQTTSGVSALLLPTFIKLALETYGNRGMVVLITGNLLHLFIGVVLMQPVSWHMKKVELSEESQEMLKVKDELSTAKTVEIKMPLDSANGKEPSDNNESKNEEKTSIIRKIFNEVFDIKLIKEVALSVECIGMSIAGFGNFMYMIMLPRAFYAAGKSQDFVAMSLSIIAFGDLMARISFIFLNKFLVKLGCRESYIIGIGIAFSARAGILLLDNHIATILFLVLLGVGRCFVITLIPLIIAEIVSREKFSGALGVNMLMTGIVNLSLGPIVGSFQRLTGSYEIVLWIPTALLAGVFTLFLVHRLYIRNKEKKISAVTENVDAIVRSTESLSYS